MEEVTLSKLFLHPLLSAASVRLRAILHEIALSDASSFHKQHEYDEPALNLWSALSLLTGSA